MELWTMPDSYMGETWYDYFIFLGRHRDSDDLTNSNFICGLRAIGGESDTVLIVNEGHWAVGWVEWIAIHKSDLTAIELANEILDALSDYPVLDDSDFSQREMESANQVWANCYDAKERVEYIRKFRDQFNFHNFKDLMGCVRGEYFSGYSSELLC
jgi:hypothetical protein